MAPRFMLTSQLRRVRRTVALLVGLVGCSGPTADTGSGGSGGDTSASEDSGSPSGDDTGGGGAVVLPTVVINELMADNETSWTPDGLAYPDWIELVNPGTEVAELGGVFVTDDLSEPDKYALPEGLRLAPGEFLLLQASSASAPEGTELPFGLSAEGEELGLFSKEGVPLDQLRFEAQQTDVSAARAEDGVQGSDWIYVPGGTPGEPNQGDGA